MIKRIFLSLSLLFSIFAIAQENTSSPYSFYGIGEVKFKGTIENRSMGSLSILPDSIHINLQNPAYYSNLKLTTFAIGGTHYSTNLKTSSQSEKAQKTALDYMAISFPAKKFAFGLGLVPYSSVGYRINSVNAIQANQYSGKGGINKVYAAMSYKFSEKFSIGAEMQYNFGEIETKSLLAQSDIQFTTREINISSASGVNFNAGVFYQSKINKKIGIFNSITFSPEANLKFENQRQLATITYSSTGAEVIVDENQNVSVSDTKIKLPSRFSFGSGIGELKKWAVGIELTLLNNSNFGNRFTDINSNYSNGNRLSIGGYYIPKYNAFSNFFKKVVYRGGIRVENTGLEVNGQTIKDQALTIGFGLPLRGSYSNLNIGLEYGSKGTTSASLVKENYFNVSLGLSFNDRWFQKRKYD